MNAHYSRPLGASLLLTLIVSSTALAQPSSWPFTKVGEMALPSYHYGYPIAEERNARAAVLFGGSDDIGTVWSTAIRTYSMASNTWQVAALTLPYPYVNNERHGAALASNGKYYISPGNGPGGWGQHDRLIEVDLVAGTAVERAPVIGPGARIWGVAFAPAPASRGGVYMFGGWNGGGIAQVSHYDPSTNTVTSKGSLSVGRTVGARIAHPNGRVYLFGGNVYSAMNAMDVFDTVTETARAIPNPNAFQFDHSTQGWVGSDGAIYLWNAIASHLGSNSNSLIRFDTVTETFTNLGQAPGSGRFPMSLVADPLSSDVYALAVVDPGYVWGISGTARGEVWKLGTVTSPCTVTVTEPNGGQTWMQGQAHDITWTRSGSGCGSTLTIELLKAGSVYETITTGGIATFHLFSHTIPLSHASGTDYRIRIRDNASGATDTSDADFTIGMIRPPGSPELITSWRRTLDLPITGQGTKAAGHRDHILVVDGTTRSIRVGDVDLSSGDVTRWRPPIAYPSQCPYPFNAVIIGDRLVVPGTPASCVFDLAPDGSVTAWRTTSGTNNAPGPVPRAAVWGDYVYLAGGWRTIEVARLDDYGHLSSWRVLPSLPLDTHDPLAVAAGGALYVIGGEGPGGGMGPSSSIHRASIAPDGSIGSWSFAGSTSVPRPHSGLAMVHDTVHLIAGGVHGFMTGSVESAIGTQLGTAGAHQMSASLPTVLNELATAVVGGRVYVLGGNNQAFGGGGQRSVYVSNSFDPVPPPYVPTAPYFNDFEAGDHRGWTTSNDRAIFNPVELWDCSPNSRMLGNFYSDSASITIQTPATHDRAVIEFDLYTIGSWDGNGPYGPDYIRVTIDGVSRFLSTFSVYDWQPQSFPDQYPLNNPAFSGSFVTGPDRGCWAGYHIRLEVPHTGASVAISIRGENITDEYWAIDNVRVVTPPPCSAATISAPPSVTRSIPDAGGSCDTIVPDPILGTPTISGGCDPVVTRTGVPGGNRFPIGVTSVIWTVTDGATIRTATQYVTVIDDRPPTIVAPADVDVATGAGAAACNVTVSDATLGVPQTADGCEVTVSRTNVPANNLFPVGTTTITWTATDRSGNSASATQTVTVRDTTVPSISAPPALTVETGPGATSCGISIPDSALGSPIAADNCSTTVTRSGVPANNLFPVGTTTITWTATDPSGNSASATQTVTVRDTTAPAVSEVVASRKTLWPPNHQMIEVQLAYTALDHCGPTTAMIGITSNEPEDESGDGSTARDWTVIDSTRVLLRAERNGSGNGRIYTITLSVGDAEGNLTSSSTIVSVPKSQK